MKEFKERSWHITLSSDTVSVELQNMFLFYCQTNISNVLFDVSCFYFKLVVCRYFYIATVKPILREESQVKTRQMISYSLPI